jgi:hypothetical protein
MDVYLELPMDPQQLKDLINKQDRAIAGLMIKDKVDKQMKQLTANAKQAKNDKRVQPTAGVSQKKKKSGAKGQ